MRPAWPWQDDYLQAAKRALSLELCTGTQTEPVRVSLFYVHTGIPTDADKRIGFRLFPTGDRSDKKGWWRFICVDMFEVPAASLATELHCLHTATLESVRPSVFRSRRLKCFYGSDFSLVFGTRFHACPPCWWGEVLSLQGTPVLFRGAFRYNRVYRYGQEYRYTVPPVKNTGNIGINNPSCIYLHTCTPAAVDFYSITVRMLDSAE